MSLVSWIRPLSLVGLPLLILMAGPPVRAEEEIPAPLNDVLRDAEDRGALKISYTMRFDWPGASPVTARFDATTSQWQLLAGDPEDLPAPAREKFQNVQRSESRPGGLLYGDFRPYLADIALIEETETHFLYSFVPTQIGDAAAREPEQDILRTRLIVTKDTPHLTLYEVRGLRPFKPNPATKMEEFVVTQRFAPLGEDGPVVLRELYSRQKGDRFFRPVDIEFTATFSAFTAID
ncbi:hypothetical protein PB2503_06502 [Parvularcula bermudensis HTCC2503]|uniref:Outer membrane lipoprotein-sorting protein n=1 Tax=Parvularcula bermudensis (strain ATCC BAA-594 / HTCC2503 / KCTC 12087) TaxID=314260 RepID=E0TI27_PARBH|nr:hypothetical protein [Parvularcula bermudensis]ADM09366.1 hypothetical protein PB2503_06502 [Parvularcula bermudensis HTCC2503]